MWSIWNAPSDRDYYYPFGEEEHEERCAYCGSGELEACEPWCEENSPAAEPAALSGVSPTVGASPAKV